MVSVAPVAVLVKINALCTASQVTVNGGEVKADCMIVAALLKLVAPLRLIDEEVSPDPANVMVNVPGEGLQLGQCRRGERTGLQPASARRTLKGAKRIVCGLMVWPLNPAK